MRAIRAVRASYSPDENERNASRGRAGSVAAGSPATGAGVGIGPESSATVRMAAPGRRSAAPKSP